MYVKAKIIEKANICDLESELNAFLSTLGDKQILYIKQSMSESFIIVTIVYLETK